MPGAGCVAQIRSEAFDGRRGDQAEEAKLSMKFLFNFRHEFSSEQRLATKVKKVVANADFRQIKKKLPDQDQLCFYFVTRRNVGGSLGVRRLTGGSDGEFSLGRKKIPGASLGALP